MIRHGPSGLLPRGFVESHVALMYGLIGSQLTCRNDRAAKGRFESSKRLATTIHSTAVVCWRVGIRPQHDFVIV